MPQTLTLSADELRVLTGFRQQAKQLDELHRRGFWRARVGLTGVILERAHYEAVCSGAIAGGDNRPKLRAVR